MGSPDGADLRMAAIDLAEAREAGDRDASIAAEEALYRAALRYAAEALLMSAGDEVPR